MSLSGLLVTFGPGSNRQIAVGIFLCLFFIRVSAYFNALRLDEDDILNEFCSWQPFFILFLTLLLKVDAAPPGVGAVLLGTAIFSFIAVLGLCVGNCCCCCCCCCCCFPLASPADDDAELDLLFTCVMFFRFGYLGLLRIYLCQYRGRLAFSAR